MHWVCVAWMCVGQASSPTAETAGQAAELLADIGWQVANSSPVTSSRRDVTSPANLAVSVCGLSARAQDIHRRVKRFIDQHVLPVEQDVMNWQSDPQTKWTVHPRIEQLKVTLSFLSSPSLSSVLVSWASCKSLC